MSKKKVKEKLEKHENKLRKFLYFGFVGGIFIALITTNKDLDNIAGFIGLFGTTVAQSITDTCVDCVKGIIG